MTIRCAVGPTSRSFAEDSRFDRLGGSGKWQPRSDVATNVDPRGSSAIDTASSSIGVSGSVRPALDLLRVGRGWPGAGRVCRGGSPGCSPFGRCAGLAVLDGRVRDSPSLSSWIVLPLARCTSGGGVGSFGPLESTGCCITGRRPRPTGLPSSSTNLNTRPSLPLSTIPVGTCLCVSVTPPPEKVGYPPCRTSCSTWIGGIIPCSTASADRAGSCCVDRAIGG